MATPGDLELSFVLEEDAAAVAPRGTLRPEFEAIPARLRSSLEVELRAQAFDLLHEEAVARGELAAAPAPAWVAPRGVLRLLLALAVGAVGGALAVAAASALLRWVTATLT